jgi:phenylacetic acid degradation protein
VPTYSIEGVIPVVHPQSFVHPTAVLIGDVVVGARCYVGPFASLRGDFGSISLQAGSNIQDNCTLHCFPGKNVTVEEDGHVGHGAILHGCHIGRAVLVGMNSVVMDGCVIGETSFVGAGSTVRADTRVPAGYLVAGNPATIRRPLTDQEIEWKANGTTVYQELAKRCLDSLQQEEPLSELDEQRPRLLISADRAIPLRDFRNT